MFHILNRTNDRRRLFSQAEDYEEFLTLLRQAVTLVPMRICAWCLMPNHWHIVLWPTTEGDISLFMHWLSSVHAMRVRRRWNSVGCGHVYQDRFKSIPVETGVYYRNVIKYVEANAWRAGLVRWAEDWPWSSLHDRVRAIHRIPLARAMDLPADWTERVNEPVTTDELNALREAAEAGRPYGSPEWQAAYGRRRKRTRQAGLAPKGR